MKLSGARLDDYSAYLEKEDRDKVIEDNFKMLRQTLNGTGIKNVVEQRDALEIAMTGTATEKSIPGYSKAFRTSGGFVEIHFNSTIYVNGVSSIALYVDEKRVAWANCHGATHINPSLHWDGYMNAGAHKVDVRVSSTGGANIEVGHDDSSTRLTVRETLL